MRRYIPHPWLLALALVVISGAIVGIEAPWRQGSVVPDTPAGIPPDELQYPAAADFGGATAWINAEPLDLVELRGKVVLVDFWTYSCINCIHTFPYTTAWYEKYRDDGFVLVGVHTPEFRFERDTDNVRDATQRYGITYPVAMDNEYAIWSAYHNRYWPAEYLIDQWGRIRHTHFGEGGYEETEEIIQQLLREAGHEPEEEVGGIAPDGGGAWKGQTPELYAGAAQGPGRVGIGNPEGYHPGETLQYARVDDPPRDRIYLAGTWHNDDDHVTAAGDGTSVLLRFKASAANFVANGTDGGCVEVLLDGAPIGDDVRARDVNETGGVPCIGIDSPRSYDFYAGPFEEHLLELRVPAGFELYSFAFSAEGRR